MRFSFLIFVFIIYNLKLWIDYFNHLFMEWERNFIYMSNSDKNHKKSNPLWFFGIETPRPIGYYSGTKRDFQNEMESEEADYNLPIESFLPDDKDGIFNDEDFKAEQEELWEKHIKGAKEDFTQKYPIYMIAQSHIDVAWKWRFGQSIKKAILTYGKAVKHMNFYPEYTFHGPQPSLFEMIRKENSELFEKIKEKVANDQFQLVGGCWTEPDPRMPSGEAYVRERLYGQRYFLRHFGKLSELEWMPDSFGYANQLPQLIARSGGKWFFTNKIANNKDTLFPTYNFHWYSPDGSSVLTYIARGGYNAINLYPKYKKSLRMLKKGMKLTMDYTMDVPEDDKDVWSDEKTPVFGLTYGAGDGGHGVTAQEYAQARYYIESGKNLKHMKAKDLYQQLEQVSDRLPEWHDEMYYEFHRATLSSIHLVKKLNRKHEWMTQSIENVALIGSLYYNFRFPYEKITQIWKNVCLLHMHDVLPGSSIPEVYDDCVDFWDLHKKWYKEIESNLLKCIMEKKNLKIGESGILLINPMAFSVDSVIEIETSNIDNIPKFIVDSDGNSNPIQLLSKDPDYINEFESRSDRIIFKANLPPLGMKMFQLDYNEEEPNSETTISLEESEIEFTLENLFYKLTIDKSTGNIASLQLLKKDKDGHVDYKETLAHPSNILTGYNDWLPDEPAWNFINTYRDMPFEDDEVKLISVKVIEKGPVRWTIEKKFEIEAEDRGKAAFTQLISMYKDAEGIDLEIQSDNKIQDTTFKCDFYIAGDPQISIAETPYGTIKRKLYPTANHDKPRWENNMQTFLTIPAKDNSFCFNILNEGKYGYDNIEGNRIGITVIRTPGYTDVPPSSWVDSERTQRKKNGDGEPPSHADLESYIIRLRLMPKLGSWEEQQIEKSAHSFNSPIFSRILDYTPLELSTITTNLGVQVSSIKFSEINNEQFDDFSDESGQIDPSIIIIRAYETLGIKHNGVINIPNDFQVKNAVVSDLLEREIEENLKIIQNDQGSVVEINGVWKPHEIKTILLIR
jgi:alpha-mannosidase